MTHDHETRTRRLSHQRVGVSVGVGTGGDGGQWRQGLFFDSNGTYLIPTLRRCSISCSKLSFEHQIITDDMGMNMDEGFPTGTPPNGSDPGPPDKGMASDLPPLEHEPDNTIDITSLEERPLVYCSSYLPEEYSTEANHHRRGHPCLVHHKTHHPPILPQHPTNLLLLHNPSSSKILWHNRIPRRRRRRLHPQRPLLRRGRHQRRTPAPNNTVEESIISYE